MKEAEKISKYKKGNLYKFVLITFAFSWIFWIPKALVTQNIIQPSIITDFLANVNLGAYGPLVAAFYMTFIDKGIKGVKDLLKRGIDISFKGRWLIPILLLMPTIAGGAIFISSLNGEIFSDLFLLSRPLLIAYWFIYLFLTSGPLQEEFGWRGYALDRLQSRHTALISSLILGFIWAMWHLPLNLTNDVGPQYSILISTVIGSIITLMLLSVFFTWIYNNTGRSILAAMLFHASMNLATFKLFPVFEMPSALPFYTLFILIGVIAVTIIWGRKKLVKEAK